jgi:hypothetical protein
LNARQAADRSETVFDPALITGLIHLWVPPEHYEEW